jgi:hypothetical protein
VKIHSSFSCDLPCIVLFDARPFCIRKESCEVRGKETRLLFHSAVLNVDDRQRNKSVDRLPTAGNFFSFLTRLSFSEREGVGE